MHSQTFQLTKKGGTKMGRKLIAFIAGVACMGLFSFKAAAASHVVQKGDSLWSISQKYGTSVEQLKSVNNLAGHLIYPNQRLHISGKPQQGKTADTHTVVKGDSLWKISQKYGVSIADLKAWNNLSTDTIYPGQSLAVQKGALPASASAPAAQPAPAASQPSVQQNSSAPKQQAPQQPSKPAQPANPGNTASGKEMTVTATAYTADCNGCSGVTATGIDLRANPGLKVIAVDPSVIPLGSKVYVEGYGTAIAGDTGGAIKGNKIDVFIPNKSAASNFGVRTVKIKVLH
jgi:3D (Asp-Asp-Asp) domain-containing protein/LysM repeat protein